MTYKYNIITPVFLILPLIASNIYCYKYHSNTHQGHYYQMTSFYFRQDQNIPPGLIYFIGDSHTQGLATQAISLNSINYGIGSDTTDGVLKRLSQYKSIKTGKAIVLAIGFNDLKVKNNEKIFKNIKLITKQLPSNIPIFINTLFPVSNKRFDKNINNRIIKLNTSILKLCKDNSNLHCINIHENLTTDLNTLNDTLHIGDGLHLNSSGYAIWINKIRNALNQAHIELKQ